MIKEAASKTTTSATAPRRPPCWRGDFLEGLKIVTSGGTRSRCRRHQARRRAVCEQLQKMSEPLDVKDKAVVSRSARWRGQRPGGRRDALHRVLQGRQGGAISVEEGKGIPDRDQDRQRACSSTGFLSPHFVTNPASVECVLENPYIFLFEEKLSPASQIVPILEKIARTSGRCWSSRGRRGEALATLVVNKLRGVFQACAVKAPGYGDAARRCSRTRHPDRRAAGLQGLGVDLLKADTSILGRAKKVIVDADYCTILGGPGQEGVEGRCAQIRAELETANPTTTRRSSPSASRACRAAWRSSTWAPRPRRSSRAEKRVEDALHSVRARSKRAWSRGGVALLRAPSARFVKAEDDESSASSSCAGRSKALRVIAGNAGYDPSLASARSWPARAFGFNAETGEFGDLKKAGILDPVR